MVKAILRHPVYIPDTTSSAKLLMLGHWFSKLEEEDINSWSRNLSGPLRGGDTAGNIWW